MQGVFGVMDLATPYLYANKIVVIKLLNKFLLKRSLNLSGIRGKEDRLEGKRKYDKVKNEKMQVIFKTNVTRRKGEGSEESKQEEN